jgi:hypothetical protein
MLRTVPFPSNGGLASCEGLVRVKEPSKIRDEPFITKKAGRG